MTRAYDPPPAPPDVSPDARYLAQVFAHGTRATIAELRNDREQGPGISGWASAQLAKLPVPVQTGIVFSVIWLALQLGGALYERLTGHAPPQPSQPTITSTLSPASAADMDEQRTHPVVGTVPSPNIVDDPRPGEQPRPGASAPPGAGASLGGS